MLDKHIPWTDHVRAVENKIVKNIGLLYRVCNEIEKSLFETKTYKTHCI